MIGRYNRIEKVYFKDGDTSYFLVDKNNKSYDCDLLGDFWFNEFKEADILNRVCHKNVNNLSDVTEFMNEQNVNYKNLYINKTLLVGGEHDMVIYEDLHYKWYE